MDETNTSIADLSSADPYQQVQGARKIYTLSLNQKNQETLATKVLEPVLECLCQSVGQSEPASRSPVLEENLLGIVANLVYKFPKGQNWFMVANKQKPIYVKAILSCLSIEEGQIGRASEAARAIWNLSLGNPWNRHSFVASDVLAVLAPLITSPSLRTCTQACGAFWSICGQISPFHKKAMEELAVRKVNPGEVENLTLQIQRRASRLNGIFATLLSHAQANSLALQFTAIGALGALSMRNRENQQQIGVQCGGLDTLLQLLRQPCASVDLLAQILQTIGHLALENPDNQSILLKQGGLEILVQALYSPSPAIQIEAAGALASVCFKSPRLQKAADDTGAITALSAILKNNNSPTDLKYATLVAFSALCSVTLTTNQEGKEIFFVPSPQQVRICQEAGGQIIELLQQPSLVRIAVKVLGDMLFSNDTTKGLLFPCLEPLLKLLREVIFNQNSVVGSQEIQLQIVETLASMVSKNPDTRVFDKIAEVKTHFFDMLDNKNDIFKAKAAAILVSMAGASAEFYNTSLANPHEKHLDKIMLLADRIKANMSRSAMPPSAAAAATSNPPSNTNPPALAP